MNLNIIQNIKYIIYIYFTPFPYAIYNESTRNGNFAFAGVGLGLINSQQIFWNSNVCTALLIYNRNNVNFYYVNIFVFFICIFLYILSFVTTYNLIRYLPSRW